MWAIKIDMEAPVSITDVLLPLPVKAEKANA
jgi:hypothetical protein